MPALTRRSLITRRRKPGRRRTSLGGGNRGIGVAELATPLWGFEGPYLCGNGDIAGQAEGGIAQVPGTWVARLDFWVTRRTRNDVIPAQGYTIPYRLWPMRRRLAMSMPKDTGIHGGARCDGGARIGCPRIRISTTIIAAPQCGQTKAGWMKPTGASASWHSATALGATCSSSRARARFSRRPALATSP